MTAPQIPQQFPDAGHGQQLELRQIHGQRLHLRAILRRGIHPCRKPRRREMLTRWTPDGFHLVFRHHQAQLGQLMDLPAFFDRSGSLWQLALAGFAVARPMSKYPIRGRHWLEGMSLMSRLSPLGLLALWARPLLAFEAVTRRRLATVMAIFRQPFFQFFDPLPRSCQQG